MKRLYSSAMMTGLCLLGALALGGCTRLTAENYDKLRAGMSFAEVKKIIGTPTICDDVMTLKRCVWRSDDRSITVGLASDKVVWLNAENLR